MEMKRLLELAGVTEAAAKGRVRDVDTEGYELEVDGNSILIKHNGKTLLDLDDEIFVKLTNQYKRIQKSRLGM